MTQHSIRIQRVADEIKKLIGIIIQQELSGTSIGLATVIDVKLSKDLKYAKVYVSIMGDEKAQEKGIELLKNKTGFIKRELGKKLYIRYMPDLQFCLDNSLDYAMRIDDLIKKIHSDEEGRN